ncbi:hypothetical protein WA026_001594, partial [Henosepilachna vigintioctopunctata]
MNEITRPNENRGTCVDHIFLKSTDVQLKTAVVQSNISDHFIILGATDLQNSETAGTYNGNWKINFDPLEWKIKDHGWSFIEVNDIV